MNRRSQHLGIGAACLLWMSLPIQGETMRLDDTAYEIHAVPADTRSAETTSGPPRFYLRLPPESVVPGVRYPVVLFLHGAGERGDDLRKLVIHLPDLMTTSHYRQALSCYFVVPQCGSDEMWVGQPWSEPQSVPMPETPTAALSGAMRALDATIAECPVDESRIYVTGLSMGGFGAWELGARTPERFAAIVPVCGGGDERQATRFAKLPVWAAHGENDDVVDVGRSRTMVKALRNVGSPVRYTEYPAVGHASWNLAYALKAGILPWMFEQRKE